MSIYLGSAAPTTYKLGAAAVSKIYLGATQIWTADTVEPPPPPPPASVLTMTRSNNGGTITGWDGTGTTGDPFTRATGYYLSDFDGLSYYSWTATAAATVTLVFDYNDDSDNAENYQIMLSQSAPPYEVHIGGSGNPITQTVSVFPGDVIFFSSTGDPSQQYFANVSVSAA